MKIRITFVLALIFFILNACANSTEVSEISAQNTQPTFTQTPSSTLSVLQPSSLPSGPTNSAVPLEEEVIMLTSEPPEIILTALNLQIDSNNQKLTLAANQIATMATESALLKTQLALAATDAANNSSNQNSSNSQYNIPSYVYTVVTVDKAVVFEVKSHNKSGAPIMLPYEPRVSLPPGTQAWVYPQKIKADGGTIYYESYDPDGQTALKVYFKSNQIQIRLPNGRPDPENYPLNVAKAVITDNTVLFVVSGYDNAGKPIMDTYKPLIRYTTGKSELVYPEYVVGTGGTHWYPVYDPDGKPSGYIRSVFISFPPIWD